MIKSQYKLRLLGFYKLNEITLADKNDGVNSGYASVVKQILPLDSAHYCGKLHGGLF
jgi:hypothetical protein